MSDSKDLFRLTTDFWDLSATYTDKSNHKSWRSDSHCGIYLRFWPERLTEAICNSDSFTDLILLFSVIYFRQWAQNDHTTAKNSLKTHSHTATSRHHHSKSLSHNSWISSKCETVSSIYEAAAKKDSERLTVIYDYSFSVHTYAENENIIFQISTVKKLPKTPTTSVHQADTYVSRNSGTKAQNIISSDIMMKETHHIYSSQCRESHTHTWFKHSVQEHQNFRCVHRQKWNRWTD